MTQPERNHEIFKLRKDERLMLSELASRFGVTRERIRQICRKEAYKTGDVDFLKIDWAAIRRERWRKALVVVECPVCQKQTSDTPARALTRKGCSSRCASIARRKYTRNIYDALAGSRSRGETWKQIAARMQIKNVAQVFFHLKRRYAG